MTMTDAAEAIQRAASAATYGGSTAAVVSGGIEYLGLSPTQWTLLFAAVGALVAVLGFIVNTAFVLHRMRMDRKEKSP